MGDKPLLHEENILALSPEFRVKGSFIGLVRSLRIRCWSERFVVLFENSIFSNQYGLMLAVLCFNREANAALWIFDRIEGSMLQERVI
ncbi:hypothetical protein [Beijerinckia indica]|nr:hypothetical protein [Beijerinckia indica]